MDKKRIAITGASGLIGSALTKALQAQGYEVISISVRVELNPIELEGLEAVFHLAGENIGSGRWSRAKKTRIFYSRVDGTHKLVSTLNKLKTPPKVLICASAIGYYGTDAQDTCTEEHEAGTNFLATVCTAWEAEANKFKERVVTPRFATVLAKQGGALAKLLPLFKWGLGGKLGSGEQWMSWISLDDLVSMLFFCMNEPSLKGAINASAPHPVSNSVFTKTLAKVLKRPALFHVPSWLLKLVMGQMAQETLLASCQAEPKKLLSYGFTFAHPHLQATLEHLMHS